MKNRLAVVAGVLLLPLLARAFEPAAPVLPPAEPVEQAQADPVKPPKPEPIPVYPLPAEDLLRRLEQTERRLQEMTERADDADTAISGPSAPQIDPAAPAPDIGITRKWFDRLSIRGYTQVRHNDVLYHEPGSAPPQHVGDRSVENNQNFLIRRARLIIEGDVGELMRVYLQPDFASSIPNSTDSNQFCQIRDWYADIYTHHDKIHRFRVGQSKVPYGWENLQSSSNRAPLDRTDPLNSAVRNERDLGIFYYWTPPDARETFKYVLEQNLKGSGDYGVFGFGAYNGQGGSLNEQNDNLHLVCRVTYPFRFDNGQILEMSMQGYTGKFTVLGADINPLGGPDTIVPANTRNEGGRAGIRDQRLAWSAILYPQPIGFQAEWNVGSGPGLDPTQTIVEERALYGGYAMVIGKIDTPSYGTCFPYYRWSLFKGGYKPEPNAPYSFVDEHELGVEWQPLRYLELTTAYAFTNRTNVRPVADAGTIPYEQFKGQILRIQLQFSY